MQTMLKQSCIELDKREVQSLYERERKKFLQQKKGEFQNEELDVADDSLFTQMQYELVKEEVFPTSFVPFCLHDNSKQSSLKLYHFKKDKLNFEMINKRLTMLFEALNSLKTAKQRQKLTQILRINQIQRFIHQLNQQQTSVTTKQEQGYFSYFQEGKSIEMLQLYQFQHSQQNSSIPYEGRELILKDFKTLLGLIDKLMESNHVFRNLKLGMNNILLLQYGRLNANQLALSAKYFLRVKIKWVLDLLLCQGNPKVNQTTHNEQTQQQKLQQSILRSSRKILRKILGIQQEKQKLSQTNKKIHQKIEELLSFDDIIKLNYQDIYPYTKVFKPAQPITKNNEQKAQQSKEELQNLRQQIHKLEQMAKNELKTLEKHETKHNFSENNKSVKIPQIKETKKQNNQHLWATIEQYILSNVTESERNAILMQPNKNPNNNQPLITKKTQKAPKNNITTQTKKQAKPEQQKIEKKQQSSTSKQQQKQLAVESDFIASASSIKFRPQRLLPLIQNKQSILYIMKTKNKHLNTQNIIVCFINAKPSKENNFNLFGSYCSDSSRKSFIYSEKSNKFYKLLDKNHAVGYGPEIFLSIGKLDFIVPCFGTEWMDYTEMLKCVSYFPVSYSVNGVQINQFQQLQEEDSKADENRQGCQQIGIEKEFFLEDIDIYEIKLKSE